MTISNEPLLSDIFSTIGAVMLTNATLKTKLGATEKLLRLYRNHPKSHVSYPRIIMTQVGQNNQSQRKMAIDYFILLTLYTNKEDHADEDIIVREIMSEFDEKEDKDYSINNTKIEWIQFDNTSASLWDEEHRVWITPINLIVKARRKNNIT